MSKKKQFRRVVEYDAKSIDDIQGILILMIYTSFCWIFWFVGEGYFKIFGVVFGVFLILCLAYLSKQAKTVYYEEVD